MDPARGMVRRERVCIDWLCALTLHTRRLAGNGR
jgi:hypothetical protein